MYSDAVSFPILDFMERLDTIAKANEISIFEAWELHQSIADKAIVKTPLPDRLDLSVEESEERRFAPVVERVTKERELNAFINWLFNLDLPLLRTILKRVGVTIDNERTTLLKIVDKEDKEFGMPIKGTGLVKVGEIHSATGWEYRSGDPFPDRLRITDRAILASLQDSPWKIVAVAPHRQGGVCLLALALVAKTHTEGEYFVTQGVALDA